MPQPTSIGIASALEERDRRIAELEKDNADLRKYLATSKADCPYCGLPAADMAKCAHGFPGCGRADDMN